MEQRGQQIKHTQMLFQLYKGPFFEEITSRDGGHQDPQKLCMPKKCLLLKIKGLQ